MGMIRLLALLLAATPSPPPDATATQRGLVNTKAQTFSGLKSFDGGITAWTVNGIVPGPTTQELALYLDVNGNDANPCTAPALPCRTVQGVFDRVPHLIRHNVRIFADAGTYGPATPILEGIRIQQSGGIFFNGMPIPLLVDGGTQSGTLTAVTNSGTFPTVTDSSQAWVVNSLRGAIIRLTSGAAVGNTGLVYRNSATQLELVGTITGTVAIGNTYELLIPGTVLTASTAVNDVINPQPLTIRNIHSRLAAAPAAGGLDGGPIGPVQFSWVRLQQLGTATTGLSLFENGSRVTFSESAIEATISPLGRNREVFLARTVVRPKATTSAINTPFGSEISSLLGPYLLDCSLTNAACIQSRGVLAIANTTMNVIDTPSSSVGGVLSVGGLVRASTGGTTSGWRINCNGGPGYAIFVDGAASSSQQPHNGVFDNSFFISENCQTGLRLSGGVFAGQTSSIYLDAGTAISLERGARLRILNAPTLTNVTTELSVDSVTFTMATLNAASPQVVPTTPNVYGTWISR